MTTKGRQTDLNYRKSFSAKSKEINSYIYIYISSLITNSVLDCYSVFLLVFLSPSLIASFFFYTLFSFHLYLSCVGQMVSVDICPISTFLKFLCNSCKAKNHCLGIIFTLMLLEGQLQSIQCGGSIFFLDILGLLPILCFCNTYPYQQNFLERSLRRQTTSSDLGSGQLMRHSSLAHLPRPL